MKINDLTVKEYQILIEKQLRTSLKLPVKREWRAMKEHPTLYSPRVDIAVGPFVYDASSISNQHNDVVKKLEKPIKAMLEYHRENVQNLQWEICNTSFDDLCQKNLAARCFLAIEIENGLNPKHMTGDIINAISLGRLGIVVPFTDNVLKSFGRIRKYIWYLSKATNLDTTNLLILTKEQLIDTWMS